MAKKKNDSFSNLVLDEKEQLIEEALEKEEYQEDTSFEETKEMFKKAAKRYQELNKTKPITIRVNQLDLIKVKAKARKQNIPYQTLLSSLINQYAQGDTRLKL